LLLMLDSIEELLSSYKGAVPQNKRKFDEFVAHCYYYFDQKICKSRSDMQMNKYKHIRTNALNYIVANRQAISNKLK